jgi:hypothetical protein
MVGCGHCGFPGLLERKDPAVEVTHEDHEIAQFGWISWTHYWVLHECPACHEPSLEDLWWSDEVSDPVESGKRLYPTGRDNSALPPEVQQKYDAALRVKRVDPGLYAVAIGRMIEAIAREEGASGRGLTPKIRYLAENGRLPTFLVEVAEQLRDLRNLGAHDDEVEVVPQDARLIEDFAEAILEYLYRAPANLQAIRVGLAEREA